jgi:hypothetical protein
VRTDVRVAVLSYLNTDWYIQQMKRRAYKSQPLPISMSDANYVQGNNDILYYNPNAAVKDLNLKEFISLLSQNSPLLRQTYGEGGPDVSTFPTSQFYLPVDTTALSPKTVKASLLTASTGRWANAPSRRKIW